ncbi:MAG: cyclic-di-AMP receptor [Clostridia bacterium]|nr:cyclic-di-AMP receptor [Clostridia bacterium]MBQ1966310.1 cyclic-di-AMP receptor [Clostridia bacterium]
MKMIFAIVNNDDSAIASSALTEAGFFVTKLSTTGGFLMVGNTTLLIGTSDEDAAKAIEILQQHCTTRKQVTPPTASFGLGLKHNSLPEEVTVGGVTVFVMNVERFEKF